MLNFDKDYSKIKNDRNMKLLKLKDLEYINTYGEIGLYTIIAYYSDIFIDEEDENHIDEFGYLDKDYIREFFINHPTRANFYSKDKKIVLELGKIDLNNTDTKELVKNSITFISKYFPILLQGVGYDNKIIDNFVYEELKNSNVYYEALKKNMKIEDFMNLLNFNTLNKIVYPNSRGESLSIMDAGMIIEIDDISNYEVLKKYLNIINNLVEKRIISSIRFIIKVDNLDFLNKFNSEVFPICNGSNIEYILNINEINTMSFNEKFDINDKNITFVKENEIFEKLEDVDYFIKFNSYVLSKIPNDASDLEKITYISKFISLYMDYGYKDNKIITNFNNQKEYSLFDLIKNRIGVCRHLSKMLKFYLDKLGIECEEISFGSNNLELMESGTGHQINSVLMDGILYFIDITQLVDCENLSFSSNYLVSAKEYQFHTPDFFKAFENEKRYSDTFDRKKVKEAEKKVDSWIESINDDIDFFDENGLYTLKEYVQKRIEIFNQKVGEVENIRIYENLINIPGISIRYDGQSSDFYQNSLSLRIQIDGYDNNELFDILKNSHIEDDVCEIGFCDYNKITLLTLNNCYNYSLNELKMKLLFYVNKIIMLLNLDYDNQTKGHIY